MQAFTIDIPQARLDDLKQRLQSVNWAADYNNSDWGYGVEGDYLRELTTYWLEEYDWRQREAEMNSFEHFRTEIDGTPIHFIRQPGVGPNPAPLILTHGWPWTFWDFKELIGPLSDPAAHGGDPADAFDVIVPSLPGFTFSNPLRHSNNWADTADLWVRLMRDVLGYDRFAAHGGDMGALVTTQLGHKHADKLLGIHLSNAYPLPPFARYRPWAIGELTDDDSMSKEQLAARLDWEKRYSAHLAVHMLGPQTLAYAMHDSPVGLCAWLLERRRSWSHCHGDVENSFSREQLLDNVMLYWLTDCFANSVRAYREAMLFRWRPEDKSWPLVKTPTGLSLFEYDLPPPVELDWTSHFYNLKQLKLHDQGGHFAAAEAPKPIAEDIRSLFRELR